MKSPHIMIVLREETTEQQVLFPLERLVYMRNKPTGGATVKIACGSTPLTIESKDDITYLVARIVGEGLGETD